MSQSRKILKVIDKSDSYYTPMDGIPDMPFRMIIVGKSQLSGKSTVIMNMILRPEFYAGKWEPEDVYVISNNKLDNKLAILKEELDVPSSNVMRFSEGGLQSIYDHIEDLAMEAVTMGEKPVPSLMIIDDCGYSGDMKGTVDGVMSQIFSNGRHVNLSVIVTGQKYTQLSTTMRTNATCAVLFGNSAKEVDLMTDDHCFLKTKKAFREMFRDATKEKNSFLAVDYTSDPFYRNSEFGALDQAPATEP